jgi:hypothetical protein
MTSRRARDGFRPARRPEFQPEEGLYWRDRGAWRTALDAWNRLCWENHPQGKNYLGSCLRGWPRWHDILYHNRPHRSATKRLERAVLMGWVDAEDAAWPLAKKPHQYYW